MSNLRVVVAIAVVGILVVSPIAALAHSGVQPGGFLRQILQQETPTETPTDTPTVAPTDTETPVPTDTPTGAATDTPTPAETETPTPTDTPTDTPTPVVTDTPAPTETETPIPTDTQTSTPPATDTPAPTATGTPAAGEQVQALIDRVDELVASGDIAANMSNSLKSKLEAALASLERGNENAARGQLNAFINQVEALRGKKISEAAAAELISRAQAIIDGLAPAPTPTLS